MKGFMSREVSGKVTFALIFSLNLAVMPKRLMCMMRRSGRRDRELLTELLESLSHFSQCQEFSSNSSAPVKDLRQSSRVGLRLLGITVAAGVGDLVSVYIGS